MKYGNFVGGGWLPISDEEMNQMKDFFKKQLTDFFGKDFFSDFSAKRRDDSPVLEVIVTAKLKEPFNGRNQYKETCKDVTQVCFFVSKSKGKYLEYRHGHRYPEDYEFDYENCPPFSYGCDMYVDGKERPYRCKHWERIQHWSPYTYGTEISDLEYSADDLNKLRKCITKI